MNCGFNHDWRRITTTNLVRCAVCDKIIYREEKLKMTKGEYVLMVTREIERSDGGKINAYTCETCIESIITIDRESGVTPFILKCRFCGGKAISACYKAGQWHTPRFEFYRPKFEQFQKLEGSEYEHVKNGGLLFRPIIAIAAKPKSEATK